MAYLRIREIAEAKDINVSELQRLANKRTPGLRLGYNTLLNLWHNRVRRPDLDNMEAIARALDVPLGTLFGEGQGPDPAGIPRRRRSVG